MNGSRKLHLSLLIVGSIAVLSYGLGLSGPFLLDDYTNLSRLAWIDGSLNGYLLAVFDNNGSLVQRPISYLSFVFNAADWPVNPAGFKAVNLAIHIAIGLVLARLLYSLPYRNQSYRLPIIVFTVALWTLHPLHVSTVLYAVQRMTSLVTLFSLVSILSYLNFRLAERPGDSLKWLAASAVSFGVAVLSKESGLLIILYIGVLEVYLRHYDRFRSPPQWLNVALWSGILSFGVLFAFHVLNSSYSIRSFGMFERMLIQGQILFEYLRLILLPDLTYMSLYHDGFEHDLQSKLKLAPLFWGVHVAIIASALFVRRKWPLLTFGVLWFYLGHVIESTIIPLELMFEHRNYLPSVGPLLIVAVGLTAIYRRLELESEWVRRLLVITPILLLAICLAYRAAIWGDSYSMFSKWAYYKQDSARAQYAMIQQLDKAGLVEPAHAKAKDAAAKFNLLGFHIYAWRLSCKGENIESPSAFPTEDQLQNMTHSSEIAYELEILLREWRGGRCLPPGFTSQEIDDFIQDVFNLKSLKHKDRYRAQLLELVAKHYSSTGNYDRAVEAWLELYAVQPTVDTALRNVDFALQFGLIEYAEEYVDYARMANENLPWIAADRSEIIEQRARYIEDQQELTEARGSKQTLAPEYGAAYE